MPDDAIPKPYIFISHSTKDHDFTLTLSEQLVSLGLETWVDVHDIPDGSTWPREIQKAVERCAAFVVVMSAAGRESEWVERETLMAMDMKKPLFIARIDDTLLPIHLINRQFTDFRAQPKVMGKKLAESIRKALAKPITATKPKEAARLSPKPSEHNFFKYVEQLPNGEHCAQIARSLFAWADTHANSITFSGKTTPAFHAHLWVGPGGVQVFSVRAYARQPAVEVPLQYLLDFAPYDQRDERMRVLGALNHLMPPNDQFSEEKADKRPNLPLVSAFATPDQLTSFQKVVEEIITRLRAES